MIVRLWVVVFLAVLPSYVLADNVKPQDNKGYTSTPMVVPVFEDVKENDRLPTLKEFLHFKYSGGNPLKAFAGIDDWIQRNLW